MARAYSSTGAPSIRTLTTSGVVVICKPSAPGSPPQAASRPPEIAKNPVQYFIRYLCRQTPKYVRHGRESPTCPIPRWQLLKQELKNVGPEAFDRLRKEAPAGTLLDVRNEQEFAEYHLEGAVNINYLGPNFLETMERLDPERTYLVYCRSGRRSVRACTLMKNAGLNRLIHLDGGLNAYA